VGASAAHLSYITRERAVLDREDGVLAYNLPESVTQARDYQELRVNLAAHAAVREQREVDLHRKGGWAGEARTHYRVRASFERDVSSERALAMVKEWLDKELPNARALAVVHRDTEHTHVHIWVDARQNDTRKIQLPRDRYRAMDSTWNQLYSRELGRDPLEHERKKAETREAKRSWARGERPAYPPRVRSTPGELATKWERREVGVQAAAEPQERPETFLECVRTQAGQDFKDAASWAELERRLERHGFRVEPKGQGIVVTDGRQEVKASAVDRVLSRKQLESRFGETFAEHRAKTREPDRIAPAVQEVVRDLRELERRQWTREDQARTAQAAAGARARADALRFAAERAERTGERFQLALKEVYREPVGAQIAFTETARTLGPDRAAELMRDQPERFGALRTVEQRRLFGIVRTQDDAPARARAGDAAELGREATHAAAAAPSTRDLARVAWAARSAEIRARAANRALQVDTTPARARVATAMQRLLPREVEELRRWVAEPQVQVARRLQQVGERMVPEQVRELATWARAPHRQLPARAVQAFRALTQDRALERRSE
jgi:hypothetical protein